MSQLATIITDILADSYVFTRDNLRRKFFLHLTSVLYQQQGSYSRNSWILMSFASSHVHIELGLCEVMCSQAMRIDEPAKDQKWFPDISELELIFPPETLDHFVECIYEKLPQWEEPVDDVRKRYEDVIVALANKFPQENLLLATHDRCKPPNLSCALKPLDIHVYKISNISRTQNKVKRASCRSLEESFEVCAEEDGG